MTTRPPRLHGARPLNCAWTAPALGLLLTAACGPATSSSTSAADAGPPPGAHRVELTSLDTARAKFLLGGVKDVSFARSPQGPVIAGLHALAWLNHQNCDLGNCFDVWFTEPWDFCLQVDTLDVVRGPTCDLALAARQAPPPDEAAVREQTGRSLAAQQATVTLDGGVKLGADGWLGAVTATIAPRRELNPWWGQQQPLPLVRHLVVQAGTGGTADAPPLVEDAPDAVDFFAHLSAFLDGATTRLLYRTGDEGLIALSSPPGAPLAGRFVGDAFSGGQYGATVGAVLDGNTLSDLLLVDTGSGPTEGRGTVDLYARSRPAAAGAEAPLVTFAPRATTAGHPFSATTCFNRQLDPAAMGAAKVSATPALDLGAPRLLPGGQCVSLETGRQDPAGHYELTLTGFVASTGERLASTRVSLLPAEWAAVDVGRTVFGPDVTPVAAPSRSGGLVAWSGVGAGFIALEPDLITRSAIALPFPADAGVKVDLALPDPGLRGLWVIAHGITGPNVLVLVDGASNPSWDSTRLPGLAARHATLFPDGTVRVCNGAECLRVDESGPEPYAPDAGRDPSLDVPITGSTDVLNSEAGHLSRWTADGARSWSQAAGSCSLAAQLGATLFASCSDRLLRFDDTGTPTTVAATAPLHFEFDGLGALFVARPDGTHSAGVLSEAGLKGFHLTDPQDPLDAGIQVPRGRGEWVYGWSSTDGTGLRVFPKPLWDELYGRVR